MCKYLSQGIFVRLQVIKLTNRHLARTFAVIDIKANVTFHIFLLQNGTEFQLQTQHFIDLQPTLVVDTESLASLTITKTKKKDLCDNGAGIADVTGCVVDIVGRRVAEDGFDCMPFIFEDTFGYLGLRRCQEAAESDTNMLKVC
jgi:hypothetical protein